MEKRISFFQFQSAKAVAKAIDPKLREMVGLRKKAELLKDEIKAKQEKLQKEINEKTARLKTEFDACEAQINALEVGIVQATGFKATELVKKVLEPTGKTDPKTGKPIKIAKYIPTDIVSYDDVTKEFVVTIPDAEEPQSVEEVAEPQPVEESESTVPPTTEGLPGSDFDEDVDDFTADDEDLPFSSDEPETVF